MAPTRRSIRAPLEQTLFDEAFRFDFFQAVRLLERIGDEQRDDPSSGTWHAVGDDHAPSQEAVRFRAQPSHAFAVGPVSRIRRPPESKQDTDLPDKSSKQRPCAEMVVGHFGLTGPSGVLPHHYTAMVIDRVRDKDYSLRDFLDLFNHRAVSLFYRAWEKYRFPVAYERFARDNRRHQGTPAERSDQFTRVINSLSGQGTPGLADRMEFDDEALLYYAGHFAQQTPTVVSLEAVLADYFGTEVAIHQFCGQWLHLEKEDLSRLPSAASGEQQNNRLGNSLVVGRRVWDVENQFRVRLGPVSYREFRRFTPFGNALKSICQMIRRYSGSQFDFVVQPVLRAEEVPPCRLGGGPANQKTGADTGDPSRLGWNTWIRSSPLDHDADDAVFFLE
jgi:type VI secretion system protein ImpH